MINQMIKGNQWCFSDQCFSLRSFSIKKRSATLLAYLDMSSNYIEYALLYIFNYFLFRPFSHSSELVRILKKVKYTPGLKIFPIIKFRCSRGKFIIGHQKVSLPLLLKLVCRVFNFSSHET